LSDLQLLSLEQRRMLVDTRQLWEAWKANEKRLAGYKGSLSWASLPSGKYLLKSFVDSKTKIRKARSLGPRSEETERIYEEFKRGRAEAKGAAASIRQRIESQARLNLAIGLDRVPELPSRILRRLDGEGLLGRNVFVAGTNAIYAYEAAAGVFVQRDLLATGDLDIFFDSQARLKLTVEGAEPQGVLRVLKATDRSFRPEGSFRAINDEGYSVDLIKATPTPPWRDEADGIGADDLEAAPILNMRWVANAPRFSAVAVGYDGAPVPMACPDPRAFALYKLWMATRDPTRDPVKRVRDQAQAEVVAKIVHEHMPQLPFEPEQLTSFPRKVIEAARTRVDSFFGDR